MFVSPYSTSMEEIFNKLYQDFTYNNFLKNAYHQEKANLVKEEWITELEKAFRSRGLNFKYSIKPSEEVFHNDNGCPYYTTSATIYTFEVGR